METTQTQRQRDARRAELIAEQAWIDCMRDGDELTYTQWKRRSRQIAEEWRQLKEEQTKEEAASWRSQRDADAEQLTMF